MRNVAQIFAVVSGKGGVGKSTFVTGVARELVLAGKKVLAVDCDIGLRSLDLLFGCSEDVVFDWGDYILGRCDREGLVVSGTGGDLIAAPRFYDPALTGENLKKLIDTFAGEYDFIFLDSPAGVGTGFSAAVACAKKAIALTTPDPVCVRSCGRAVSEAEKAGVKDIRLVINMFEVKPAVKKKLLNLDECIDETGAQLLGVVPFDRALTFSAVTGREPDEFGASTQAYQRIARRLTGEKIPLVCE